MRLTWAVTRELGFYRPRNELRGRKRGDIREPFCVDTFLYSFVIICKELKGF